MWWHVICWASAALWLVEMWICTHPAPLYGHTHFICPLRTALVLNTGQTVSTASALSVLPQDLHHTRLMRGVQTLTNTQTHVRWDESRAVARDDRRTRFVCFKMIISSLKRVSLVRAMRSGHNEMSCDWCHNNLLSCSGIHRNAEEKREHHEIKPVLTWGKRESIISCEMTRAECVRHLFSGSRGTFLQRLSGLHLSLPAVQSAQIPQRRVYCRTEKTTRQSEEQHWRKQIFTMTSLLTVTLYS